MNVSIGQIYIKPGVSFPFNYLMQRWVSGELSAAADSASRFKKKFGAEFELTVNLSADIAITENVIKGPAVFRKTKDVEYTVFLPFDAIIDDADGCRAALGFLLDGVRSVFEQAGIDTAKLDEKRDFIIDHVCSDPTMLDGPWPQRS